jgi:alanine racemase
MPYSWIEISRSAFEHNLSLYRNIVGPQVNLAVVVKGNAYGHGLLEIAQLCQQATAVDWLCTAHLSEALVLRRNGITLPILVMSNLDGNLSDAIAHDISFIVYDSAALMASNEQAALQNKKARVHIKVDTGLARFGLAPQDAVAYVLQASAYPHIEVQGIFSHFAESDNRDTAYTDGQLQQFVQVVDELRRLGVQLPYVHMSNTAAASSLIPSHFNFARIGAGVYGLEPSPFIMDCLRVMAGAPSLKPVMSWKTRITGLRAIAPHASVGYARTHTTTAPTRLGIIPVGYYDGYDRRLSNVGKVLVEGGHAPVIGRVCMNATMVDVSAVEECKIGDEVILLGDHPRMQAHEIAEMIGSFNPREITTRINPLVPRRIVA